LIGEVIYGGRVTDEWDMRCLGALLKRFFCPEALTSEYTYSPDGVRFSYKAEMLFIFLIIWGLLLKGKNIFYSFTKWLDSDKYGKS
jgi:hypothetical protein